MKIDTNIATCHELILDEEERFEVTTKTARPVTIRVGRIIVEQNRQGGPWYLRATGARILKSGKTGASEKLDTWTYRNRFTHDVTVELAAEMSNAVKEQLFELGVTF